MSGFWCLRVKNVEKMTDRDAPRDGESRGESVTPRQSRSGIGCRRTRRSLHRPSGDPAATNRHQIFFLFQLTRNAPRCTSTPASPAARPTSTSIIWNVITTLSAGSIRSSSVHFARTELDTRTAWWSIYWRGISTFSSRTRSTAVISRFTSRTPTPKWTFPCKGPMCSMFMISRKTSNRLGPRRVGRAQRISTTRGTEEFCYRSEIAALLLHVRRE